MATKKVTQFKESLKRFSEEKEAPGKGKASQEEREILFATRVPKRYIKAIKFFCVENEMTLKDFLTKAIEEAMEKRGIL